MTSRRDTLLFLLFPVMRAEVLRLLLITPEIELYERQIAHLSNLALGTVQWELKQLTAAGLLCTRKRPAAFLSSPRCAPDLC